MNFRSLRLLGALNLPVDLFIELVTGYAMDHRQKLGSEPELGLFDPETVPDNDTRYGNCVSAADRVLICLACGLERLVHLPIGTKVIDGVPSD